MPPRRPSRHTGTSSALRATLAIFILLGWAARASAAEPGALPVAGLQQTVNSLCARLGITQQVTITLVDTNPRVVSMIPPPAPGDPFSLAVQTDFLDKLTDDEVTAALAHELGHVWVATNHPYLQTERLANDIAMRVVTRYSLSRLYAKLWALTGAEVDLTHYLGPEILRVTRYYAAD